MVTPGMSDPTVTGSGALSPAHRARQPDDLAGHETPGFASPPRDGFALIGVALRGDRHNDLGNQWSAR